MIRDDDDDDSDDDDDDDSDDDDDDSDDDDDDDDIGLNGGFAAQFQYVASEFMRTLAGKCLHND